MHQNAAVLTVVCLLLCLSFNYTFPLHRGSKQSHVLGNHTQQCGSEKQIGVVERTKKMAANIEQALKKIIETENDKTKKGSRSSHDSHVVLDGDLSNYEQLVIMKKYPFLDLKELDQNYHPPPNKNVRQSLNLGPIFEHDPSFCESAEKGPNVEITNRGLSGFAIPTKLGKNANLDEVVEDMIPLETLNDTVSSSSSKLPADDSHLLLERLEENVEEFVKRLGQ